MTKTVKDICDVFFKLEEKYDLNHMKIQGVFAWQLTRLYLYYNIANKLNIFGIAQQSSLSLFDKIKSFIPFIKNSTFKNPYDNNKKDYLIFDHPRKNILKGKYQDIYSYFLIDYFIKNNDSFEVLESPYLNKHFSESEKYIKYTDRILLSSYFYKKLKNLKFSPQEKEKILFIQKELYNEFNLEINLEEIFKNHILNFKHDYGKYKKLFLKKNPKKIFIVVAYENKAIIKAAKDLNIETIEIQHGTISKYHLGYSYLDKPIEYFPDKLLTFGDYWNSSSYYPIKSSNIISIGYPYFEENTKKYIDNKKKLNQILFISQGVIGSDLSYLAYASALKLKDYEFIYKLHPGEYSTWRDNYKSLLDADNLDNFTVVDNNKTPLYDLFSKSNYQAGVFSTAIYEGLSFNCKTFVFDLAGIEYLDDLIEKGYVCKIQSVDDLISNIEKFNPKKYENSYFFKKYDEKIISNLLSLF